MEHFETFFKKYDEKMNKILESMTYFNCEICHQLTPIKCEGSEPNTCAMCMPIKRGEKNGNFRKIEYLE